MCLEPAAAAPRRRNKSVERLLEDLRDALSIKPILTDIFFVHIVTFLAVHRL